MSDKPDTPEACPICKRIEARVKSLDSLKGKLSETEIEHLITEVQSAVLKKSDSITRGNTMSEEKIVLTKANFDEFYEAQKYILLLVEKMANRMEKHDAILASYGSQLADVMMKADEFGLEVEGGEGAIEGDAGMGGENVCSPGCTVPAAPAPMEPMAGPAPGMGAPEVGKSSEFEAGYKTAMADAMKKNGVPIAGALSYPEFGAKRAVSAQDARIGAESMEKNFSMKDLSEMSPSDVNAELKKRGLY